MKKITEMFRRFKEKLASKDKEFYLHILVSLVLTQLVTGAVAPFVYEAALAPVIGGSSVFGLGMIGEYLDARTKDNQFDPKDLLANFIGTVSGALLSLI